LLCREWQGVLRLMDWAVRARVVRASDMSEGHEGSCWYTQAKKQASIKLMDPVDWPPDAVFEQDMEWTLVHELLHLHFAPFMSDKGPDDPEHIAMEQAIDLIASGYVRLKREGIAS
jgi:hypothetical protein